MVRNVPDAAERDVRLRAARAVVSAPRPEGDVEPTAGGRRATGRPGRNAEAEIVPGANAQARTARAANVAVASDRVLVVSAGVVTARVVTVGVASDQVVVIDAVGSGQVVTVGG